MFIFFFRSGDRVGLSGSAVVFQVYTVVVCAFPPQIPVAHGPAWGTGTQFVIGRTRDLSPPVHTRRFLVGGDESLY